MKRLFILLFLSFYTYAILRYHIGKNVPWDEWYFILNKAFAWTGFTLISLSILPQKILVKLNVKRKELGVQGFVFALIHAVSMFILFNQDHFPKFYSDGTINLMGWLIISIGILSIIIFSFPFIAAIQNSPSKSRIFKLGKIGVLIGAFHPFLIGFKGWFLPSDWPFYMPPITLMAVLTCILAFMIRIISANE